MTTLARDFRVDGAPEGPSRPKSSRPDRKADTVVSMKTSPQVALIYRLLGGGAKIHSTPSVARAQGFDGPIMHGLSTWGHACHAILRSVADYDVGRLRQYSASFTAPVYPGEELAIHIWVDGDEVFFETRVPARDRLVLGDGRALLAPGS
jgi:acyl dehydratase